MSSRTGMWGTSRWIALTAGALALCGCGGQAPAPEGGDTGAEQGGERRTRVVLVSLDTLRLDSFAGMKDGTLHMPKTVAWAQRGVVFQNYYSVSSTTLPAHSSMLSGMQPWEHGTTANGMVFPERHETVAEILADRGFETAAVVASFPLHGQFGLQQGFGIYHNEFGELGQSFEELASEEDRDGHLHSIAERINRRSFELLEELTGDKQFIWLHYFDAHAPYGDSVNVESNWFPRVLVQRLQTNPEERDTILSRSREQYRMDVAYLDRHLDKLFRVLLEDDRYETHIVVVSDHGEAFGEGGTLGHGKRLVKVQVHVPLFILSSKVEPGFSDDAVGSVDIAPTLLSLAGLRDYDLPGGVDLSMPVLDKAREVYGMRRTFAEPFTEFRVDGTSHVLEDFLFFAAGRDSFLVGNSERVSVGDSDRELKKGTRPKRYRELFDGFQRTLAELPANELDEASRKALEALGYTQ